MIGLKNNLKNTISFSRAGSVIRKGFENISRSNALLSKSKTNDTKRKSVLVMDYHPDLKGRPFVAS